MPYYFMRDTPLQALEQLMMSQPGQKPRGGGIYRSPFRYTPEDVACEYCQNYCIGSPSFDDFSLKGYRCAKILAVV